MSSSFPVFYVYVKHVDSEFTYIGTFPSRFVADEWWRAVSTSSHPSASHIARINAQFYTMKSLSDVKTTLSDANWAARFKDRVFFTLINGVGAPAFGVIPQDEHRELISGQAYYIRSRSDPTEFWYDFPGSDLGVSKMKKTLFLISRTEPNTDGSVMLLSDEVTVHPVGSGEAVRVLSQPGAGPKTLRIHGGEAADAGVVMKVKLETFLTGGYLARRAQISTIELWEVGKGEAWELI